MVLVLKTYIITSAIEYVWREKISIKIIYVLGEREEGGREYTSDKTFN